MKQKYLSALALAAFAAPVFGANPIFTDRWTADPAPLVEGDTIYVYTGHDNAQEGELFNMPDWVCYSSKDLKTWQSHGVLLSPTDFPFGKEKSAWAAQVVKKGRKYYWYATMINTRAPGAQSIGVAVADSPLGPWKAHEKPVIVDTDTPSPYWGNDIDPTVFVDDDGTGWLVWGNPVCYIAKLKSSMLEVDGEIRAIPLPNYTEGPWLDKRGSTYYIIYPSRAHQGFGEHLDYATAPSPEGPWTYRGRISGGAQWSYTIHPGLARFKGRDIMFYHNATLTLNGVGGATGRRCVTADWVEISPKGPIKPFVQTKEGLDLPPPAKGAYKDAFKPIAKPGTSAPGFSFSEDAVSAKPRGGIATLVKWSEGAAYRSVENPYMESSQCDGFNMHGQKDSMSETFKLDANLRLARIDLYLTDGEGTDKDNPLRIVLRTGDEVLFDVSINYVPQGYGLASLSIDKARQPLLKAGTEYTLELCGRKNSAVAYWRRGWDGKKPHAFALYGEAGASRGGEKAAVTRREVKGSRLLAYRTPGDKGGLSFLADNGDGKWEHGFHRDFRMTYSNLGNWGEKAILDPFVVRTRAGENHLFFSYVDHRRPSFGHAMSWNKGNVRNWGRENWIDLPDLDKSVHVSDPLVVERKDGNFTVVFLDAAGDGAYKVVTDGKKALGPCEKVERAKYDVARERLVKVIELDGRAYTGNVVSVTKEMRDGLRGDSDEWHKTAPWHFTIDNPKDDEKRYGEISKGASLKLSVKTPVKPYAISDMLIGLFFEDINSSYELYSTNHVGTYKGHGWRKEAGEALAALKPKFMRFPGGCIVHGHDFKSMYHWKETVGPVSERKGKPNPCWGTYMDFALGYFEYFQLCEDIGAEPLPILPAGVSCPNPQVWVSDEELAQLVQDAVDLVDFAKGDPQKSKWAKVRADMGHPKPFRLNYIGIGNEEDVNDYFERGFKPIFEAIRKKDLSIKVVGTAGPSFCGRDYEEGWKLGRKYNVPILDEHYYVGCGWFYGNQHFYDDYDRKGPKVYAGEYAAHKEGRGNDMETALACAIHLANLERNGDVVAMASYAPLFAKKGAMRWAPDLIYFDDEKVYLSTDYWTQWIFGNYGGTEYVPNDLEVTIGESRLNKDDQQRYRNRFAASVVKNGKKTIVKVINTTCFPIPFEADLSPLGVKDGTDAEIVEFAGKSFDDKDAKPVTKREKIASHFTRNIPANSITAVVF